MAPSRAWVNRNIAGPPPIPACGGFAKTRWASTLRSKTFQRKWRLWRSKARRSGKLLHAVADASIAALKYFRVTHGKIGRVPVDISRTGYTGDLGYEIWVNWKDAVKVFDELMVKGRPFDIHPAGTVAPGYRSH